MNKIINFPRKSHEQNNIEEAWGEIVGEVYEQIRHRVPNEYIDEFAKLFRPMFDSLIPTNIPLPLITDREDPYFEIVKDTERFLNSYITHSIRTRRDRELLWFLREKYGVWGNE
ncbi:hypothetical protein [Acinetobacter sp. NIPH 298]|uniref:hypothetical protein n=1 Tax=Acinetobacter sp. NIPH 298 TaxID=1217692 RepID=UPI0002D08ECF|nr:hypothetical protein [Acinetobacter sp. NIPH 298]ENW95788.1 hypothetical protein F903_01550 [Acinetobacter sp. NIPH 298]